MKKDYLTKGLAIGGTVLVWAPVAFMVFTGLVGSLSRGRFMVDFLIPAELFPVFAVGAGLLLWAALRAHERRALVSWGIVIAVAALGGLSLYAMSTGLASGATEPEGMVFVGALILVALYSAMLPFLGVVGALLIRDIFRGEGDSGAGIPAVMA